MLGRLGIVGIVLAIWLTPIGGLLDDAAATPQDVASTHAYLVAGYAALHATVTTWPTVEANIHKLDRKFKTECPNVGAGSPQNNEEQQLAYETAGALWATGYRTDAKIVQRFVKAVSPLRWSNPTINRDAQRFVKGMREMTLLKVPDLCGDVRTWSAGGFGAVTAATKQYVRHVEAIEVKEIPRGLLRPYVQPTDKGLVATDERLALRFEELEVGRGMEDWDMLLETLALNQ
ncbi:MAG TPA: hypothetical protein VIG42_02705 [Solirubrobacteraceae bacterium]|jgi:hypothetical protein